MNKTISKSTLVIIGTIIIGTAFFFSSCSKKGLRINIGKSLKKVDVAKMTSDDYFEEGTVLAGKREHSWQGDLYRVPFLKATIVQEASAATKNEASVKTFDGKEFWTKYVVKSKPAKKEDLKVGMLVMVCGDNYGRDFEKLKNTNSWDLRKVKDLGELYKNIVNFQYYDTYWNTWKDDSRHINNVRIIEGEFKSSL